MQQPIATLTFLSYTDFVAELAHQHLAKVRLESGSRDRPVSGAPGPFREYIVTLTALTDVIGAPEVLACTFRVGGCWEIFKDQHPEHQTNLEQAVAAIRVDLEKEGIAVRPGVYAHETHWGYATADGLWHFQKDGEKVTLVPETPEWRAAAQ